MTVNNHKIIFFEVCLILNFSSRYFIHFPRSQKMLHNSSTFPPQANFYPHRNFEEKNFQGENNDTLKRQRKLFSSFLKHLQGLTFLQLHRQILNVLLNERKLKVDKLKKREKFSKDAFGDA